jgi:hypothetical protein
MLAIATLLFFALGAPVQTGGATLLVEARDQTGAPLPGVVVSIKSEETGLQRAGTTTDEGTVWLVRLPAGTYTLSGLRGGFKTEVVRNIRLDAAARGRIALVFTPGAYTEEVAVEADASARSSIRRRC